jgi:hypothetical protein
VCAACPGDSFCNGVTRTSCTICSPGTYEIAACSATSDRQCAACPANSYCVGSDVFPCSPPCLPGTYRTKNCTAASDQTCSACPAGSFCLGGAHAQSCRTSCPAGDI